MILSFRRRSRFRSDTPKPWVRAGRILLIVNAIVLITSCFTEHLWTFDHFLRGGQDFEMSLLALIAFVCLVLVFAQYFRRRVSDLLDRGSTSSIREDLCDGSAYVGLSALSIFMERPPGPPLCPVILRI